MVWAAVVVIIQAPWRFAGLRDRDTSQATIAPTVCGESFGPWRRGGWRSRRPDVGGIPGCCGSSRWSSGCSRAVAGSPCRFRMVVPLVNEITHILSAMEQGDPNAAGQLWPLVYEELRRLAGAQLAHESPGRTL